MTSKQGNSAGVSVGLNSVSVETLESRVCLSATAGGAVGADVPIRQLTLHTHHHETFSFTSHVAQADGRGRVERSERYERFERADVPKFDMAFDQPLLPLPVIGFGPGFVGVIIFHGELINFPPVIGQPTDGPSINPSYGRPDSDGGATVTPPQIDPQVEPQPAKQQQQQSPQLGKPSHDPVAPPADETPTRRQPLVIDSTSPKPVAPSASRVMSLLENGPTSVATELAGTIAAKLQSEASAGTSALSALAQGAGGVNFAGLVFERFAGGDLSAAGLSRAIDSSPAVAAQRVQSAAAEAAVGTVLANQRFFEFAHLGSPFALLSDSVANFVEDSASLPAVVAQARSSHPWALTAGVAVADVVLLTYMYRQSRKLRKRFHFARAGGYAYEPFAS